ncbi:Uncharacterised protein [Campylobacter hyointestinalis subsp. hyointestinalis]|uniref:Uncharacterized protein n=1 Tax=Campylobacter hyointestinalis subsp. hyointestinalis TaxID=91352 RepID=A0A0S4SC17_CAMHY|nr:Uncharacterised protein [Campylobacter hyointestinalis subsp. hyointestinalis]
MSKLRKKSLLCSFVGHKAKKRRYPLKTPKKKVSKAYYDKASKEFRIPTKEILPNCPIYGGDLKIKISLTMEELKHLVLDRQAINPKLHSCEFHWKTHQF